MKSHKVIWQEGMLLRPQHFQHNDRYYDDQLKARTQLLGRYQWGFLNLEIDLHFLSMGKLVVSRASGVLPDGSLFSLDGSSEPLALDVPPNTANTPVFLALPLVTGNHVEARRSSQPDVLTRYTVFDTEVSDSNAGDDSTSQISCARLDFRLLLGEQQNDQAYVKLKLCDILDTSPDAAVSLDANFVPSFIHVHASPYLQACLKEVITLLDNRGEALAERIQSNGKVGGAEVGDFLMLQLINRTSVVLRHFMDLPQVHPEELYRALLGMLGELSTFGSESKRPRSDSQYQHNNQGASFRQLMGAIRHVLSLVLEQHAIELPLEGRNFGVQVAKLNDRSLLTEATFVLAASAACSPEDLRKRLPVHLKVGSAEQIRDLVNLHLPGIKLRPLPVAPRQIPFHSDKTYFALDFSADDLAQMERTAGFAFHVSGELVELELKFWAIRKA
ncbi:type VI secretion system baseplate subunit TssK [Pseudomonas sp. SDI]|uniref:type VI secretion system baseplate subunit TssK n=1 Tax=Pseudomonas sp. SDI TaxID=2170734 RepID=UPI000DE6D445|nr:type VI secretion system baseplate subunit TssK [Pseudomonas sp. SDI]PWB31962.1 type VI secretion system baseplate subunit TssK [Pseudomonas sp. SDI]